MDQRLSIITLAVKDLQVSTDFYVEKLGWTKSSHSTDGISFFHLNEIMLGLYPLSEFVNEIDGLDLSKEGRNRMTLAYLAKSEEDIDKLFADFKTKGIRILKTPEKVFWGGYSGYIEDPDGNLWEIAYNPFIEFDDKGNLKK